MLRLPLPVQLWFSIRITKTVLMWWRVVALADVAASLVWAMAVRVSIVGNMHANPSRTGTSLLKRRDIVAPLHAPRRRRIVGPRPRAKGLVAGVLYPHRCEEAPRC